jgi:hypothetical protein
MKGIEKANSISFSVQNGCMFQKLVQVLFPQDLKMVANLEFLPYVKSSFISLGEINVQD